MSVYVQLSLLTSVEFTRFPFPALHFKEKTRRIEAGTNALNYVVRKTGASAKILNYLK